jgi:hypothetical protein
MNTLPERKKYATKTFALLSMLWEQGMLTLYDILFYCIAGHLETNTIAVVT